jgi:hypothetical protein
MRVRWWLVRGWRHCGGGVLVLGWAALKALQLQHVAHATESKVVCVPSSWVEKKCPDPLLHHWYVQLRFSTSMAR